MPLAELPSFKFIIALQIILKFVFKIMYLQLFHPLRHKKSFEEI